MNILVAFLCFLSLSTLTAEGSRPWGSAKSQNFYASREAENKKKWSSLLTVDPSKMVSIMAKHGGLVLPKHIVEKDLKVLSNTCHVDEVLLNVVERRLQLRNFTLYVEGNRDDVALRVGRMYVQWDSYLRPCLSIEVDDVDINIEFLNIVLTRSNW